MSHIFISYSHKDKKYVEKLEQKLIEEGFNVWIDHRIDYGSQWPKEIQRQLDTCDAFIVVVSENSYESKWVQNEVARADRKGKPFFPILLQGDPWLSVEAIQFVDVTNGSLPPENFFARLKKEVINKNGRGYFFQKTIVKVKHLSYEGALEFYENEKFGFRIEYPNDGKPIEKNDKEILIDFPVPWGTNLRRKRLKIVSTENEPNCRNFLEDQSFSISNPHYETINQTNFLVQNGVSAAAGKGGKWFSYSTGKNNICVVMIFEYVLTVRELHEINPLEFDMDKEQDTILEIVSTFEWKK